MISIDANHSVIGSVIFLTLLLMFIVVPKDNVELFKTGFGALIAWGAGYAMGKSKGQQNEKTTSVTTSDTTSAT